MGDEVMKKETDPEMLQRLGADGAAWAAEFRETALRLGYSDMDEGWLIGWFCNAIENGVIHHPDVKRLRSEAAPDLVEAARDILASRMDTYRARNNRQVGIQDESGEKCWIVPFDEMHALELALSKAGIAK